MRVERLGVERAVGVGAFDLQATEEEDAADEELFGGGHLEFED